MVALRQSILEAEIPALSVRNLCWPTLLVRVVIEQGFTISFLFVFAILAYSTLGHTALLVRTGLCAYIMERSTFVHN